MTDRPTASTINDAQLDELHDLIDHLVACLSDAYDLPADTVLAEAKQAVDEERAARRNR
jgi:hypothetical protein